MESVFKPARCAIGREKSIPGMQTIDARIVRREENAMQRGNANLVVEKGLPGG